MFFNDSILEHPLRIKPAILAFVVFDLFLEKITLMGLLNQQGKKGDKKQNGKQQKNVNQSKFIGKSSKAAGGGLNKKGLTGGSRGS